jgi:DNA helicase HerA-like ATPase
MAVFEFDRSDFLGKVREVDTRKVSLQVGNDEDLYKAAVGRLVALKSAGAVETWLIGNIDKLIKTTGVQEKDESQGAENNGIDGDTVINTVRLTLVGTVKWDAKSSKYTFSRSIAQVPGIDAECFVLRHKPLEKFMSILSAEGKQENSLEFGKYSMDESAIAFLDGDKLFQRHAALLGSTGSGKSWTVASILEQAEKLPSANLVVFDLHGEYKKLSYARHLRIPGPEELGKTSKDLLYLPYWLLNAEEMQSMFIDRSEFSAHNQVMVFQDAVIEQKQDYLLQNKKNHLLDSFTLDSPIPFSLEKVLKKIKDLNEEMEAGARGLKQGKFYGQFSRLLTRIRNKLTDKRFGFMFQAPASEHKYETMAATSAKLMDYHIEGAHVKVIDFSEVPSEILPVIVGLVGRIIYQVQFWTDQEKRRPLAFICDEAHLYIPKKEEQNPVEKRAVEAFEKIAKEGRKYGVALMIISQRPSDVSPTVLSQCNNVIALRLTNADDQNTVKKLMPESLESMLDVLPIMDIGEALVVGDAVLLPTRIRINPPREQPLGATVKFWTEWQQAADAPDFYKSVENMRRQRRDT